MTHGCSSYVGLQTQLGFVFHHVISEGALLALAVSVCFASTWEAPTLEISFML